MQRLFFIGDDRVTPSEGVLERLFVCVVEAASFFGAMPRFSGVFRRLPAFSGVIVVVKIHGGIKDSSDI